jgi:hypothetical protein
MYLCSKIYNKLPSQITNPNQHNSFDSSLQTFLLQNPFYTLDEFFNG